MADSADSLACCSNAFAASASRLCRTACVADCLNSPDPRTAVRPNTTASTSIGHDPAVGLVALTAASPPSCSIARMTNERPIKVMKKAAIVIEPSTIETYTVAVVP